MKIVEQELKTEANELIKAAIKPPATSPFKPTGKSVFTSIGKALSAFVTTYVSGSWIVKAKAIIPGIKKIRIGSNFK